jgi:2-polyprenyl-6-hydroxyphenyl methylase/3-demethylubiquinone-9 3-methyltransferase
MATVSEERFAFGENWAAYLDTVDEHRIGIAVESVQRLLGRTSLAGASFLDIGSGSGLFSLAAHRLGAARIHSLDYDPASVATTRAMQERFAPDAGASWTIGQGDVLDAGQMAALGTWDVVYSWGVLHHTGAMWAAIDAAAARVSDGGDLAISIYNDQGATSRLWTRVKRTYQDVPPSLRPAYVAAVMAPREMRSAIATTLRGRNYLRSWTGDRARGMSRWHDMVDWVGGYPFDVARPEEVFAFLKERGFRLEALKTCAGGLGCNEFRFTRA